MEEQHERIPPTGIPCIRLRGENRMSMGNSHDAPSAAKWHDCGICEAIRALPFYRRWWLRLWGIAPMAHPPIDKWSVKS